MNKVLVDTGYWYALLDPRDSLNAHNEAKAILKYFDTAKLLVPWPTLYETFNTRFLKYTNLLLKILDKDNVVLIDDTKYRENAFNNLSVFYKKRALSLVDLIIREILSDNNTRIDYLVSFNVKDFQDICRAKQIPIVDKYFLQI